MNIKHILKSGRAVDTVKGHKITRQQAEAVYILLEGLNERKGVTHEKKTDCAAYGGHDHNGLI